MAVYYWINQGRLGNLLFQYAALLQNISDQDRVVSFHNEAFDLLEMDHRFKMILGNGRRARQLSYLANSFADWSMKHRIVTSIVAEEDLLMGQFPAESGKILRLSGFVKNVLIAKGFFQDGRLKDVPIKIKAEIVGRAQQKIEALTPADITVGVHIRLTDYGSWTVLGAVGTVVSADWYRDRMNEVRARLKTPAFIVFSDDIFAAKRLNLGNDVVYFEGSSALEDFTALALCSHTIISPSSFGWWSAFAIQSIGKIIVAPEYWAGFKSKIWYPVTMRTQGIEYYAVH